LIYDKYNEVRVEKKAVDTIFETFFIALAVLYMRPQADGSNRRWVNYKQFKSEDK